MMGLVVLGSSVRRFHFFGRRQAMLVGDGGSPMADAHEEKALLGLCNAHRLRLSTPTHNREPYDPLLSNIMSLDSPP